MISIRLGNSYSKITGLTAKQEKGLSLELSYIIGGAGAFYTNYGLRRKSLLSKRGDFPTGLRRRVHNWLFSHNLLYITEFCFPNNTANPIKIFNNAYKWQNDALKEAYTSPRGSIRAPTGTGKSRCMSMIAESFGLKTLWVVPSIEIKKQTIEAWGHLKNITITNIDDSKLEKMKDFDMLLIDECHRSAAKRYHKLNKTAWTNIFYRYSFSATTFRNDPEEQLLYESIAGQEIYTLSYKEAVLNKYIVPIEAYYIESPKKTPSSFTYPAVYNELVVKNTAKNMQLANIITSLQSSGKSTLCLVKEIAHGKALQELTGFHFINGQDEESRKHIKLFSEGSLKAVISTIGIMSEGVDTRACEYILIAYGGKAKSQFMQACGRAVRNYPGKETAKVIIVKDRSHKFIMRHYNSQVKTLLDEYGVKPVKLEV